jgi:hypothetical protein
VCEVGLKNPKAPTATRAIDGSLSNETNYRTEIVAVLSNQPQGGFITRRPRTNVNFCARRFPERRRLFLFFPGQLGSRRLSSDATGLVVGRGMPRPCHRQAALQSPLWARKDINGRNVRFGGVNSSVLACGAAVFPFAASAQPPHGDCSKGYERASSHSY